MALKRLLAGAAVLGLMAQPALAQNQQQPQPPAAQAMQQQLAQEDIDFAKKAAGDGMAEVELGRLAQQKAESDPVKQFGQRMVEDHSKANDELKSIAQTKGIDLPQELPPEAKQAYDDLQQKSGHDFDQTYMDLMVEDHQKAIDLFQQEAKSGKDPDLKNFAEQTLPTLQEHLRLAEQTQEQVTAAAGQGEQPATAMKGEQQRAATQGEQQQAAPQPGQAVSLDSLLGAEVVNTKGEDVAKIEDVVLDQSGKSYAVLGVGGFLGIGEKKVAIPLDELKLGKDKAYLMTAETEKQLKQMPEYSEDQYQPYAQK
jgi:putative membrane protein